MGNAQMVAPSLNLTKYMGDWYEVARIPNMWETGCMNARATYTLNTDQSIKIVNTCMKNGKKISAEGEGLADGAVSMSNGDIIVTPAKLKVSFMGKMFHSEYLVLYVDPNYQYALVGSAWKNRLWVLSRNPSLGNDIYSLLVKKAKELGYPVDKLSRMSQNIMA